MPQDTRRSAEKAEPAAHMPYRLMLSVCTRTGLCVQLTMASGCNESRDTAAPADATRKIRQRTCRVRMPRIASCRVRRVIYYAATAARPASESIP
jgi:hypothetical protein